MKKLILFCATTLVLIFGACQQEGGKSSTEDAFVQVSTKFGDIKLKLYKETPNHRDNFIMQIKNGHYDKAMFFRIMKQYMIQAGHPEQVDFNPTSNMAGDETSDAVLNPEFGKYHFRGALAAPRLPDFNRSSAWDKFYIVTGRPQIEEYHLNLQEQKYNFKYTPEEKKRYLTEGGYPFLDGDHSVFGEVVEGMKIVEQIQAVPTANGNRPEEDIIIEMKILN